MPVILKNQITRLIKFNKITNTICIGYRLHRTNMTEHLCKSAYSVKPGEDKEAYATYIVKVTIKVSCECTLY